MSLAIMCLAALGMVAYAVSAGLGLALLALRGPIERLAPAAQARLYLSAALAPFVAGLAVLAAALAPSFGWIADHYGGELHSHPHICVEHPMAGWPAVPLTILAIIVSARLLLAALRRAHALVLGRGTRRSLDQASTPSAAGTRVLPVSEAQAFVVGLFRPTLYVTRGLLSGSASEHLPAVMAHEEAHLRRLDPLRRFVAGMGLSFHLPGIAGWLDRCHERAQEMAADDEAANALGSREAVASALVALAKARFRVPRSAFAASGSDVEKRVLQLMDESDHRDWPKLYTLIMSAALALLIVADGAGAVHHKVEFLLGALGS